MLKKYLFWIMTISLFLLLYHPVITTYFTQDDFFHFKISQTDGTLKGLAYLIGFHPFSERGIAFYRPIFRDLLYHFSYNLFSLNQAPLRLLSFAIHFTNTALIIKLFNKLFKNNFVAYFSAFFYTINASNVATLYYFAGGIQVLGVLMFTLLSLINFINFLETKKSKFILITFVTYILAIASHEQSYVIPFLLTFLTVIYKKAKGLRNYIQILVPFFLILLVYIFLNYKVIGYSKSEIQYQTQFNLKRTVNSLVWYSGWAIGAPEMLIDFMPTLTSLDPRLMRFWGNYFRIILPSFLISITILFVFTILLFVKQKKVVFNPKFGFLVFWFVIGLLPVIFLPLHKSGHYLTPVLPPFWGIIAYIVYNFYKYYKKYSPHLSKSVIVILVLLLVALSSTSAILGKNFYWASQRGKIAEKLIEQIKKTYPVLPKGATLYVKNDPSYPFVAEDWGSSSKQASLILNGSDAIQLLYSDKNISVIYEDVNKKEIKNNKVNEITLHIY